MRDPGFITDGDMDNVLIKFKGEIEQIPPMHSAIKIKGERAYKKARAGEDFQLKSRKVIIYELEKLSFNTPELSLRIVCSKGTYIRSLVRDIGEALDCGAYMKSLRRTRIGEYQVDEAFSIEDFVEEYGSI